MEIKYLLSDNSSYVILNNILGNSYFGELGGKILAINIKYNIHSFGQEKEIMDALVKENKAKLAYIKFA